MIRATFWLTDDQRVISFKLTGHADAGLYGQDIVCAAVSVLAISSVNGLEQVVHTQPEIVQDQNNGGYLEVKDIDLGHDAQIIMQTFFYGILDIQDNYSDHIEVKVFND
ncbi:ribosomal-processing cysteine protease Prp [uncultured Limosilactobacillus sp.]|uniref:ribosomal-processing cysteine protease Prp n=1 Tax=uncultured Limosilactobacillus sp. TaxID=2837629 RepID=UPI0025CD3500|nr:ribosomal-processing cysteine protease Prp [uncultured Limosilactobacillus sp.]